MAEYEIQIDTNEHFDGERITPLYPNDSYFAHLSIYHFALYFIADKIILDAGCGFGYGSNYFALNGAKKVIAIDKSLAGIEYCKKKYSLPNLRFEEMDLEKLNFSMNEKFDVVFSSNVLEHIENVDKFFHQSLNILKPDGILIIAVPPIVNQETKDANIANPFHVNIWSPKQWDMTLKHYYTNVIPYIHQFESDTYTLDFGNTPENTRITEKDFIFREIPIDQFYKLPCITTLFIASKPKHFVRIRKKRFVEDSFTKSTSRKNTVNEDTLLKNLSILWIKLNHSLKTRGIIGTIIKTVKFFSKKL